MNPLSLDLVVLPIMHVMPYIQFWCSASQNTKFNDKGMSPFTRKKKLVFVFYVVSIACNGFYVQYWYQKKHKDMHMYGWYLMDNNRRLVLQDNDIVNPKV